MGSLESTWNWVKTWLCDSWMMFGPFGRREVVICDVLSSEVTIIVWCAHVCPCLLKWTLNWAEIWNNMPTTLTSSIKSGTPHLVCVALVLNERQFTIIIPVRSYPGSWGNTVIYAAWTLGILTNVLCSSSKVKVTLRPETCGSDPPVLWASTSSNIAWWELA